MPFWLVLLTEHNPPLLRTERGLLLPISRTVDASKFPTLVGQFTEQPYTTALRYIYIFF